jgi:hypothetical protein
MVAEISRDVSSFLFSNCLSQEDESNRINGNVGDQIPSTGRDIQKDKNLHEHCFENRSLVRNSIITVNVYCLW